MLDYFGRNYGFDALTAQGGDFSQYGGARRYEFTTGAAKGVEAVDIRTGSGLAYTILLDRGLDIAWTDFKGIPIGYMSHTGIIAPQYYEPESNEWLRSFAGGLLTTCGLTNVGAACEADGVKYGQHGRISKLPGENIVVEEGLAGEDYTITVKGQVRQAKAFVENMVLTRSIRSCLGKNTIEIRDTVENRSTSEQPFMLLYHMNFGFPLFNENSGLYIPNRNRERVNAASEYNLDGMDHFRLDESKKESFMYLIDPAIDEKGEGTAVLTNDRDHPELAVKLSFSANTLDKVGVWKNLQARDYVLCIEPANCEVKGFEEERRNKTLRYLKPMEKSTSAVTVEILEGRDRIMECIGRIRG